MPTMLFSIFGESCTEKDLYQHVECEQHEMKFCLQEINYTSILSLI